MLDIGFLNGRFLSLEQTMVSVEDRGFQFGDGVYEVIRTYRGIPFQLDAHLARLERSAEAIRLTMPYQARDWRGFVAEGIKQGGYEDSKVYIQVTRGVAPRDHAFPVAATPTAIMTVRAMKPLDATLRATGVGVITLEDPRWGRCDIKSVNLLPNVMAKQRAQEAGAFEAIFVRDGLVTEGTVSNVMVVRNGVVLTAPEGPHILSGVTRALVLDLARKEGLAVEERSVSRDDMQTADELLLTGTTVEVLPVVRVDGKPIGTGQPGPVTQRLYARFTQAIGLG